MNIRPVEGCSSAKIMMESMPEEQKNTVLHYVKKNYGILNVKGTYRRLDKRRIVLEISGRYNNSDEKMELFIIELMDNNGFNLSDIKKIGISFDTFVKSK
jgi:hypothetical protein